MVCQYHQLCRQRISAFLIYYCYFGEISSHFAFCPVVPPTFAVLPCSATYFESDSWKLKEVRQCFPMAELVICESTQ